MSEPLYHGTDDFSRDDIVDNGIRLDRNIVVGDFGYGFYLTPNLECAKSMALRKSYLNAQPGLVELVLKKNYTDIVRVKRFENLDKSSNCDDVLVWAQFIINNRNGIDYISKVSSKYGLSENNLDKRYDIVIGPIADGNVTKTARKCNAEKRLITIQEAKNLLDKLYGLQYCICTETGLSAINRKPRKKEGVSWR